FTPGIENKIAEVMKLRNVILSGDEGGISENMQHNVGLVVGAKRPQNRWPIEYFKEVAEYLLDKKYNILLFGGPEDYELAEQIKGERVFNFCGKLSPLETAEMMKYCNAVGTPLIAIFSSRDYAGKWFPPVNEKNIVFRNNDVYCSGCFSDECNNNLCIKEIKSDLLLSKIRKFLD
ncbi:MAG TPA: glycosyltransferase family 9 protein, partial [Ignavibacteriaceae bacterium]|nr:glycosyltransferase family 9 protein [Ignavibacteriaceae bacterium]